MRKRYLELIKNDEGQGVAMKILHDKILRPRPDGMTIKAAVDEHHLFVEATKQIATAKNHKANLDPWVERMKKSRVSHMGQLTTKILLEDLVWMRTTPSVRTGELRAGVTVRSFAAILQTFLSRAYDKNYIQRRLLDEFLIPKAQDADIYNPTAFDLNDIFSLIDDFWDVEKRPEIADWPLGILEFYPARLKAFILVQMTTGMRVSETCNLKLEDWDQTRGIFIAKKTKSKKKRDTPADDPQVLEAMCRWMAIRPAGFSDYIFTADLGTQINARTMTQTLYRYLAWGRKNGYDLPRITLHSLRHYVISKVAEGSLSLAQELAGHSSPKTTKRYTHTTTPALREAVKKADLLGGIIVNKRAVVKKSQGTKPRGKRPFVK